ncbi:MAG: [acyl-carrier-protein] S-malonyltransferase [Elusimicrobia bacterium RIFCSPLOWO2_02_FULL_39_32]|nr:MAG: [acyl-carrier-protein] S-malonyltransferase [Elusimicrobia bacterium GWA2_38_7]OGR79471.1 MAG: [acyl-carrier-protein] S-malonyltransferase [Elusimicrobia bacterium RIFCSPHIGHO2_02_FULL_39_36]OGR92798.1 MAG: [acyl-carrier-protein] S-malonyltransferase [Elusimicrobia bacterium RIFCSPLOWO2_02_FULL_39_32]OGR99582.1 MAG: [acyl-carrier-protein] S-malonyltransferase [Elusimicrobia bacterium RIFCSPLOWO2_12_FULL_39_28]
MKIAFLFPGQGSQVPGMGKSLYETYPQIKEHFEEANQILGFDIKNKIFYGTETELKETKVTQPAIFIVSSAIFKLISMLHPSLIKQCCYLAGHSLGEYSALHAAGAFDFQTALKLVEYRSLFMQESCEKFSGTMAAILGIEKSDLQKLCEECGDAHNPCEMVNFNAPGQIVVAGGKNAIQSLLEKVKKFPNAKGIGLNVSGAFHSSLMNEAAFKMKEVLFKSQIQDIKVPVITNCDALATMIGKEVKEKLAQQINHPVLWQDTIEKMIEEGVELFIEIGPGKVLTGLLRKIDRKKSVLNVEDPLSLKNLLEKQCA